LAVQPIQCAVPSSTVLEGVSPPTRVKRGVVLQLTTHFHLMLKLRMSGVFLIYIQEDATLYTLFYLETALHVSGGTNTHHQERKQLHLHHLIFVTPLLLPTAIAADSSNGVTNTRCCRYSCLRS